MDTAAKHNVTIIKDQQAFRQLFQDHTKPVLIDLWATWCGPCRTQLPILDEVATRAGNRAIVAKVNVDDASDIAGALGVSSIPTLIVFEEGKEKERFIGVQSADTLLAALNCREE